MNHRKIKDRSTLTIYRCYSTGRCQLLPLLIKEYSLMSSVSRYSQMRTAKQIDLIYISQDWFSSGECLVIDK